MIFLQSICSMSSGQLIEDPVLILPPGVTPAVGVWGGGTHTVTVVLILSLNPVWRKTDRQSILSHTEWESKVGKGLATRIQWGTGQGGGDLTETTSFPFLPSPLVPQC